MAIGVTGPWTENVQSNKRMLREFFYWRLRDPAFNLVELDIDIRTGALAGIGIPLYNGGLHDLSESTHKESDRDGQGIPCFDLAPWASILHDRDRVTKYFDFPGRCQFELKGRTLRIALFTEAISFRVLVNNSFVCEFNEQGEFCAFVLKYLEESEVMAIQSYVNRRRPR